MSPIQNLPPGCSVWNVAVQVGDIKRQGSVIAPTKVKAEQILRDRLIQERKGKS